VVFRTLIESILRGVIMGFFTKRIGRLFFIAITAFVIGLCTIAFGEGGSEGDLTSEVLTSLEQRMQKKISVDFRNTPIDDVIRIMAEQADVDIIKSPKVIGNVTTTLTNVPLEEALNNILAAHGYGYVTTKNMIRIAPLEELAAGAEKLTSRIYRITYADVGEVEGALKKFISQRGSLSSNLGTSNIIVTDTEAKIKAIDTFIAEIDRMTPQILVEARIYDVTSKDNFDFGVDWTAGRRTTYGSSDSDAKVAATNLGDARDSDYTISKDGATQYPGSRTTPFLDTMFKGSTSKTSGTTGIFRVGWLNSSIDIDVLIKAQQNLIDSKLLANPRVLVLDNEKAIFKIITEHPYQELRETSAGGSIGTTEFKEVGITLEVIPHLTRDRMVRLQLRPEFSVKVGEVTLASSGEYPQPIVDKREADTTLLIEDGQTVVLGGLRKREVTKQINKVPFFGDLPVVGLLFKSEGEALVNSELVVFITPWIIEQAVMSDLEQQQFEVTEFCGPKPLESSAEKRADTVCDTTEEEQDIEESAEEISEE